MCSLAGEEGMGVSVPGELGVGGSGGDAAGLFRQEHRKYSTNSLTCSSGFRQIVERMWIGIGGAISGEGDLDAGVLMLGVGSSQDRGDKRRAVPGGKSIRNSWISF